MAKSKNEKPMHFHVSLTGNAKQTVSDFRDEWEEKFGENSLMGKGRIVQILLCDYYKMKLATEQKQAQVSVSQPFGC